MLQIKMLLPEESQQMQSAWKSLEIWKRLDEGLMSKQGATKKDFFFKRTFKYIIDSIVTLNILEDCQDVKQTRPSLLW